MRRSAIRENVLTNEYDRRQQNSLLDFNYLLLFESKVQQFSVTKIISLSGHVCFPSQRVAHLTPPQIGWKEDILKEMRCQDSQSSSVMIIAVMIQGAL